MSILSIYVRVIRLLAPEKWLAAVLVLANLALAGVYFLEPWLFGKVVDSLADHGHAQAWHYIQLWTAIGLGGVLASGSAIGGSRGVGSWCLGDGRGSPRGFGVGRAGNFRPP